jgi:predicted MPP superfamily phosphohydrolase
VGRFNPYSKGLYQHGALQVYVNVGTGFWGPPLRSFVPAEITLLTLHG